ncbi:MAG: homocysteine S-methyltransferase family protein [Lachnospiraceae bacterium]|nr:homocysteine S-methyltransferase family protein [Lachnospiraceae bacterium]
MDYFDRIRVLDGGMGTELVRLNAPMGKIPEELNITHPEIIKGIHRSYIDAGSDVIYTCTFGANAYKLRHGEYSVTDVIKASVKNAKDSVKESGKDVLVALSMGTIGDILEPFGNLKFDEAYDIYKEMVTAGEEAGADVLVFETQTDLLEVKAGVLAAKENTKLPMWVTMTFETNGRTFTGTLVESMAITLESLGVEAIGVNCSLGPNELFPFVERMRKVSNLPLIIKPNAGLPDPRTGEYDLKADQFVEDMKQFLELGVSMVGGCCGTDPEYIRKLVDITKDYKPIKPEENNHSYLTSSRGYVDITKVHVVGERVNPTGKKVFKEALLNHDIDYVKSQALEQVEAGAKILDVNVGLPKIDEKGLMVEVVKELQALVGTPLQIDSSDAKVIEAALRVYNGKALINSVNGEDKVLDTILPIAKHYGAAVIGLCMNSGGIPNEAEKRVEIAGYIVKKCEEYGIPRKDIYIDCLTLAASVQQKEVRDTLNAITEVKKRYGVHTVLGVSNISFGLPKREYINTTFLTLAMNAGLDLAIINPNNAAMMGAVDAYLVLDNVDQGSMDYVEKYAAIQAAEKEKAQNVAAEAVKETNNLTDHVLKGLKESVAKDVEGLLATKDPLDIVNDDLIPALDRVGLDFEKGKSFLPQLLASASAAEAGFSVIKEYMAKTSSGETISKGKIVLATVKGDVHDIGKNIVKTILENYGFTVIDLGKDVPPEKVVEVTKAENIKLVGLSALMTTTVVSMEETIKQLREAGLDCKVMVGGAVLTEDFAMQIGADYYSKDAKQSADIAKMIFGCD